ncbi:MAG TPA: MazG family protein, partial [Acidobacteriaceae bacterium]|nr:MazG family protein [Acidobacteriaceae bacterium]
ASEAGYFTLKDVAENLNEKLIRRHPHVFGEVVANDSGTVLRNWEQIKREEKANREESDGPQSMLADVPRSMPAMLEATKLGSRAAKVGFDWPDVNGLFDKLAEETAELRAEIAAPEAESGRGDRIQDEVGDLLFTAVHLARHLHVDPEFALRGTNAKFRERFAAMEQEAGGSAALEGLSAEELERLWERAKRKKESR